MPQTFREIDGTNVDQLIYSQFIKYDLLRPTLNPFAHIIRGSNLVNVFIDVYELTNILYRYYKYKNPLSLTACIVNSAIHYRNFFRKFYGVYSNIFLIHSSNNSSINTRFCPEYNNHNLSQAYNNIEVKSLMDNNISLVSTVVPYLPDIYFRVNTVEPYVSIADLITRFKNHNFNPPTFVISNNALAFQIPIVCDNTIVLAKRRDDIVYVATRETAINQMMAMVKKREVPVPINPAWLSGLFTLIGYNKRDVTSLCGTRPAFHLLHKMMLDSETLNPDSIFSYYCDKYKSRGFIRGVKDADELYSKIHNRFKCFDLNQQIAMYCTLPESKENGYLYQLQDKEELFRVNDLYFRDNPMQLDLL